MRAAACDLPKTRGQTEIDQVHLLGGIDDHVLGLQISVRVATHMKGVQGTKQLHSDGFDLRGRVQAPLLQRCMLMKEGAFQLIEDQRGAHAFASGVGLGPDKAAERGVRAECEGERGLGAHRFRIAPLHEDIAPEEGVVCPMNGFMHGAARRETAPEERSWGVVIHARNVALMLG